MEDRVQLLVVCEAIPVLVKQLKAPPPTSEENQYQHLVEMASAVFMLKNLANETEGGMPPLIVLLQSVDMELKLSAAKIRLAVIAYACLDTYGQWFHNRKNISKITKAIKMVAASKLRAIQIRSALLGELPSVDVKKNVIVTISSDKGLCGGINSTVVKKGGAGEYLS
ncbi:hypothetical protein OROHE_007342 [Orobanche hederae]